MFEKIRSFFASQPLTIEQWSERSARLLPGGPDEIIAAAIVQSFGKDISKWVSEGFDNPRQAYHYNENGILTNKEKGITLKRIPENRSGTEDYRFNGLILIKDGIETELTKSAEKLIISQWELISIRVKKAEEAAEIAKKKMNKNEAAWNIAEDLLGMKRDENGALVPVKTAEG